MEVYQRSSWFLVLLIGFALIADVILQETTDCPTPDQVSCTSGTKCNSNEDCQNAEKCCPNPCYTKRCIPVTKELTGDADTDGPSENDCRPYIEKALKELEIGEVGPLKEPALEKEESAEDVPTVEITDDSSRQVDEDGAAGSDETDGKEKDESLEELQGKSREESSEKVVKKIDEIPESEEETRTREESVEEIEEEEDKASVEDDAIERDAASEESREEVKIVEDAREEAKIVKREAPEIPIVEPVSIEENEEAGDRIEAETPEEESVEEATDSIEEPFKENVESEEQSATESVEEIGCPPPNEVSCTEGELCTKHRNCGENQICCPNKCYRRRCTQGSVPQEELDAESASEESEEAKSEEKSAPKTAESGCPPANEVSCTGGDLCTKHRNCGENQICCANKCYRRRCIPGSVPQEELDAESASEESEEVKSEEKVDTNIIPETGCPAPSEVSCTEGDLCSKHKHCGDAQICCPNKCYRKRCTPGEVTSAELAAELSEESAESEEEKSAEKPTEKRRDTGCPLPNEVSCVEGDLCSKHKHCGAREICCPNKCYRKRCTPGTPTDEDLAGESDEDSKEVEQPKGVPSVPKKDTGCPARDGVPCAGEKCNKNKECHSGEICCANKCYRKVCVAGKPDPDEKEEESEEEASLEAEASAETQEEEGGCPSPDKVSCVEGDRCGNDDDCGREAICCPNKCYNKRCIPGTKKGGEESVEEVSAEEPPPPPPPKQPKVPEKVAEIKKEHKTPPPPAKKEAKKPEIKPIRFESPVIIEEDESFERTGEAAVEELSLDTDIPTDLRPREHVEQLLKIDQDATKLEKVQNKVYEETLKELKRLYENAIKPLEVLYKYRDLSNRHFGDAEIFSKPLILFMGPWSGGKSSIINYLLNNEYNETSLRTGAEPSPAYFNILMHGDEAEIIDGAELAADFTFSGLQKFGQGLEERLRGVKLPVRLLEKVNIVEIPGILEVRKQVSRVFPFNDACQWFIDRADIIFLVYDPSKLDVGPETEAILDQLKGREHQTRIILNKADQVKPEELMRVQGALIWNISPLMSSPQPPVMYTTSLWSRSYEPWAPIRLLQAQERAFLRDLRTAVDRRVENKIASARRFAVRVRNHAKMVDCYLTTYYNHKSVFGNRKQVANEIIERPQDYHIYEGLSTLTNISRYDLPDPDVYRDFFKLNPLYEFQQLSATCTYFRGCPINRLDIAIAYDLPELIGTYKRNLEEAIATANNPPKEPSAKKTTKKTAPGS